MLGLFLFTKVLLGLCTVKSQLFGIDGVRTSWIGLHQESSHSMNTLAGFFQSSQFVQFAYLQALDLLSTAAFLSHGVGEANPVVRWSMSMAPNPVSGLLAVKLLALCFAVYCIKSQRELLLAKVNIFYAVLIVWNMVCLVMASRS